VRAPWWNAITGAGSGHDLQASAPVAAHPAAVTLALLLARAKRDHAVHRATNGGIRARILSAAKRAWTNCISRPSACFVPEPAEGHLRCAVAFNIQGRLGAEAKQSLESIESDCSRNSAGWRARRSPWPSLMLVQAPTFHAHVFSIYIGDGTHDGRGRLREVHTGRSRDGGAHPRSRRDPSNVTAAGRDEIVVT